MTNSIRLFLLSAAFAATAESVEYVSKVSNVADSWCNTNCNWVPRNCPANTCMKKTDSTTTTPTKIYYRAYPYQYRNNDPNTSYDAQCTADCNHNPPAPSCDWRCIERGAPNPNEFYKSISSVATDQWCYDTCNHIPPDCPSGYCQEIPSPGAPTPYPTQNPTLSPTPYPTPNPTQNPTLSPTPYPTPKSEPPPGENTQETVSLSCEATATKDLVSKYTSASMDRDENITIQRAAASIFDACPRWEISFGNTRFYSIQDDSNSCASTPPTQVTWPRNYLSSADSSLPEARISAGPCTGGSLLECTPEDIIEGTSMYDLPTNPCPRVFCVSSADERVSGEYWEDIKDGAELSGDFLRDNVPRYIKSNPSYEPFDECGDGDGGDPTDNCERRRRGLLTTLEKNWFISEDVGFSFDKKTFTLEFDVSDNIADASQVSYKIYEADCTTAYNGDGLTHSKGSLDPNAGEDLKSIDLDVVFDPDKITDESIWSETESGSTVNNGIDFCVRLGVNLAAAAGGDEVNFLEVIVEVDITFEGGFSIDGILVAPKDKCENKAEIDFELEAYFCEPGKEDDKTYVQPALRQGDVVTVCVRPTQEGLDNDIKMKELKSFTWERGSIQQDAIFDSNAAPIGLSILYCTAGFTICHFDTILRADFYRTPGTVSGSGSGIMQFGGAQGSLTISPRKRRLAGGASMGRNLQQEEAEQAGEESSFDMTLDISAFDEFNNRSASCKHSLVGPLAAAVASICLYNFL